MEMVLKTGDCAPKPPAQEREGGEEEKIRTE